jgi:hypothetical protein
MPLERACYLSLVHGLALLLAFPAGVSHAENYYQCWSMKDPSIDYGIHALSPPALWNEISEQQGRKVTDAKCRELCGPNDLTQRTREELIACKNAASEREIAAYRGEALCEPVPADDSSKPHGSTLYTLRKGCGNTLNGKEQLWLAGVLSEAIGSCNMSPSKAKNREFRSYEMGALLLAATRRGAPVVEGVTLAKALGCKSDELKQLVDQGLDYFVRTADPNAKRPFLESSCEARSKLSSDQCRCLAAFARVIDPGIYDHYYDGRELFGEMNRAHPMLSALPLATCGANPNAYYQYIPDRKRR